MADTRSDAPIISHQPNQHFMFYQNAPQQVNTAQNEFLEYDSLVIIDFYPTGSTGQHERLIEHSVNAMPSLRPLSEPLRTNQQQAMFQEQKFVEGARLMNQPSIHNEQFFYPDRRFQSEQKIFQPHQNDDLESMGKSVSGTSQEFIGKGVKPSVGTQEVILKSTYCSACQKYFTNTSYLKQHNKAIHNGEKPFKCGTCGKRFGCDDIYHKHLAKHLGNKPYKCKFCSKQFNYNTDLKRHAILHMGQKPHSCKICGKAFIRQDHMMRHYKMCQRRLEKDLGSPHLSNCSSQSEDARFSTITLDSLSSGSVSTVDTFVEIKEEPSTYEEESFDNMIYGPPRNTQQ